MSNFAFMINETYLKAATPLTQNVDVEDLKPFIQAAQDTYIKDKIGSNLYNQLITAITNNTFSTKERELLDLIAQSLAWYTCFDALPFIAIKLRNKGVLKTGGDFATNADMLESKYLRQECRSKADYYLQRVQDYLCLNSSSFPNYSNNTSSVYPNTNVYSSIGFDINDPSFIPYDYFTTKETYRRNNNCNCNGNGCNCNK